MDMKKKLRIWMARRESRKDIKAFNNQRAEFYEDLASALDDRIDTATFLKTTAERLKKRQPRVSRVMNLILNNLVGEMTAQALKGVVPASERMIIAAAEQSGRLIHDLHFLAENTAQMKEMSSTIRSSLMMPLITFGIAWSNVWIVCASMMPLIKEILPGDKLKGSAEIMYYVGYLVSYATVPLGIAAAIVAVKVYRRLPTWISHRRRKMDKYFPLSMYRDWQGALFILSLSSLIRAGSGLKEAVGEISEVSGPWMRWHCNAILNRLAETPDKPGLAFDTGILPRKIADRLIDVADRSQFGDHLEKIGLSIVRQTNKRIAATALQAELVIGVFSALLMIGITIGLPPILEGALGALTATP